MNRLRIRLTDQKRFVCSAALAAVLVLLAGGAKALATTNAVWCVPNTKISTACTSGDGKAHIQDAVSAASPGDIILVGPGHYNETVDIQASNMSIFGAQAGKDARVDRNDPSKESIVDASGTPYGSGNGAAFYVNEQNVVIDGFTIQGGTTGNAASGIYVSGENAQILNNVIQNNAVGVYLDWEEAVLIEYNLFKTNNKPTAGSWDYDVVGMAGFGIAGGLEDGDAISENAFEGNLAAAMYSYDSYEGAVTENTSKDDGSFVFFYNCQYTVFSHNQGQDFGAKGFLPVYSTYDADAAIDLVYYNYQLQINDNDLEEGNTAGYNGIAFNSTITPPDYVCEYCQVSGNTIKRFPGNGIVAEPYSSSATLYYSIISRNYVEDNGNDGILIGLAPDNEYNSLFDNKMEGNHVFDCADDTTGPLTLGTYNTWFNNSGGLRYPTGLCVPVRLP
jgi:hypothetical protein